MDFFVEELMDLSKARTFDWFIHESVLSRMINLQAKEGLSVRNGLTQLITGLQLLKILEMEKMRK